MAQDDAPGRHFVRSVRRAFDVIKAFGPDRPRATLSDVAQATDLDRATARRLLLTLTDLGYVRQTGRREFELTPRVLELGYSYLSGMTLVDLAQPHLQAMSYELHETASLTTLDGDEVVYIALAQSSRLGAIRISVGSRFEAYATSMGRVLLAGLDPDDFEAYLARVPITPRTTHTVSGAEQLRHEVSLAREQGWAMADQELEQGLRGIAAPVRDRRGCVIAAANVSTHAGRASEDDLTTRHLPMLLKTAAAIEADLGRVATGNAPGAGG